MSFSRLSLQSLLFKVILSAWLTPLNGIQGTSKLKLFDAHCHLQDPRIYQVAPQLIQSALDSGVRRLAVNGIYEKDWHLVKQMGEEYPSSVIPCFGLHPWFIANRTSNWFNILKDFFNSTPSATVGEIGLDKGPLISKDIGFKDQVEVFRKQLELAKELKKPVTIHCVLAFDDLIEIMQSVGPLPCGAILHSYQGSDELVPVLANLGAYFSISGHTMSMKPEEAKKMLKSVPSDRILLETDAPDALPTWDVESLHWVPGDASKTLNQPANIHNVLSYTASQLEMPEAELAKFSYKNALRVFSCQDLKVNEEELIKSKSFWSITSAWGPYLRKKKAY